MNLLYLFPSDFLSPSTLLVLLYQHWINFFTSFNPSPNSFIVASYILLVEISNYIFCSPLLPSPSATTTPSLPFISFLCTHLSVINNLTLSTPDIIYPFSSSFLNSFGWWTLCSSKKVLFYWCWCGYLFWLPKWCWWLVDLLLILLLRILIDMWW